ncbi:uncharacterized protein LOC134848690 [Symsagittifera roscoffensis]|uniref:uncharacterized protein LOC134848690 n=1 Tax=Symsagittifera roscoffensis TaxID=84072 RepID=UPI00307B15EF
MYNCSNMTREDYSGLTFSQIPGFIKLPVGGLCYAHVYRVRYYRWLADIKTEALFNDLLFCAPLNPLLGDESSMLGKVEFDSSSPSFDQVSLFFFCGDLPAVKGAVYVYTISCIQCPQTELKYTIQAPQPKQLLSSNKKYIPGELISTQLNRSCANRVKALAPIMTKIQGGPVSNPTLIDPTSSLNFEVTATTKYRMDAPHLKIEVTGIMPPQYIYYYMLVKQQFQSQGSWSDQLRFHVNYIRLEISRIQGSTVIWQA